MRKVAVVSFLVVPNSLSEEIYRAVDAAIAQVPESDFPAVVKERDRFYHILLAYFDEHGVIPTFSISNEGRK